MDKLKIEMELARLQMAEDCDKISRETITAQLEELKRQRLRLELERMKSEQLEESDIKARLAQFQAERAAISGPEGDNPNTDVERFVSDLLKDIF